MAFSHRTWAEISVSALVHNFKTIQNSCKNSSVMAVVKANAYGHGTEIFIPALLEAGADNFAVSTLEEAEELRSLGVKHPILILGYTPPEAALRLAENDFTQTVYDKDFAEKLSFYAKESGVTVRAHIKLDTGMSRLGFDCRDDSLAGIKDVIECLNLDGISYEGVFTHFSSADTSPDYTAEQYNRFIKASEILKSNCEGIKTVHCCNSAGILIHKDKHLDVCRLGISLYGLTPDRDMQFSEELIPVMTLKSVVTMVKEIEKDTFVGYGRTFKSSEKMKIATVAVGYADGYPRLLSNKGEVIINGQKAKVVGRICMDQMTVDVSNVENVQIGDEVILFGRDLPVVDLAYTCDTISHEIVCGITKRVPRIKVD